MAKFAVFLVAKILKMHIFLTFLNGYIHPNNFKNKNKPWALPQTPLTCEAAGAGGKPYPPTPTVSVVDYKASRVKCTTSSPLTLSISVGVAKLTEADGAGNLSRLAKQPRSGLAFTGWRRPNACGKGAGGFSPAPLPRGERGCGQRPRCWQDPWGSRSRGKKCAVGTHFKGFGFKAQSQLCVALLGCLVIGGRMSAVSLKLPHAPCAPLSLDNLQVLVQSLLWPLAEPFHPKLG